MIRGQETFEPRAVRVVSDPSAIVVVDLKGDKCLFNTVREEANRRGQPFLFFTAEPDKPSYYFNPFTIFQLRRSSLPQQSQQLLDVLGLNNGEGYGRDHFTRIPRHYLLAALKEHGTPTSFRHLHDILVQNRPNTKRANHDSSDLEFAVEALCFYPQLFTTPEQEKKQPKSIIRFERVLEERQIVYFWLPAVEESIAMREIGKLVLFNALSAAKDRQDRNLKGVQLYLFIDEFQRLVGESLQIILEQARSYGIGVVLSNHSSSQLRTASGRNLWPVIHGNTAAMLHFGTPDPDELKMLSDLSGETWRESTRTDTTTRSYGQSQSWRDVTEQAGIALSEAGTQELAPRMTTHDLLNIFSEPRQFLLHVYRNTGFSRFNGLPIPVRGVHCMDEETYKRRSAVIDWPAIDGASSGILRNPSGRVEEALPREQMNAIIGDLFGAESAS